VYEGAMMKMSVHGRNDEDVYSGAMMNNTP